MKVPQRYGAALVFCHWAGALLMLLILLSGELRHFAVHTGLASMRSAMVLHIGAGMAALALLVPRLLAKLIGPCPPVAPHEPRMVRLSAHAVHLLLYVFLIVESLLGWAIVNAKGMRIPMPLLGFEFPALVPASADLVAATVVMHAVLARVFYVVLAMHIGAALWHHLGRRDDTLRRMTWHWISKHAPIKR